MMAFDEFGVTCRNCGKFIPIFTPALPTMPNPFSTTCPYCETAAIYEKSAVKNFMRHEAGPADRATVIGAIMIACLVIAAAIWSMK